MMIPKFCIDLGNGGFKGAGVRVSIVPKDDALTARLADARKRGRIVETFGAPAEKRGDAPRVELREVFTAFLPSKVGVGNVNMGALSLGGMERKGRERRPIQIVSDDGAYLVGHGVEHYAQLLERFDPSKYADSPELRAVMRALLAQMVDGGSHEVALAVALPIDVLMSAAAKETVAAIGAWLLGEHRFTYDGKAARVTVREIRPLAQPVGAWAHWGMNTRGEWARDEDDLLHASVAVLDSGFNTLDLLLVKNGRIEKRYTGGDNLGVRVAAQEIANALKARFGIEKSLIEVDAFIRDFVESGKATIIVAGNKVDLKPIIRQSLNSLATRTVGYVQETWGNAREFSYVLLVGGGALALDAPLRKHIPHAQVLPDPVHANAIGLAKLAQRAGLFKSC